jgi:hypothetical protein
MKVVLNHTRSLFRIKTEGYDLESFTYLNDMWDQTASVDVRLSGVSAGVAGVGICEPFTHVGLTGLWFEIPNCQRVKPKRVSVRLRMVMRVGTKVSPRILLYLVCSSLESHSLRGAGET